MQLVESVFDAHFSINCYRPQPGSFFRSSMNHYSGALNAYYRNCFDHSGNLVMSDVTVPPASEYSVVAHELGHWLGLAHVACGGNEPRCYGSTPGQRSDVMGMGGRVNGWHAGP